MRDTKQQRLLKKKFFNHQLMDPWRIAYPNKKNYTHYSSVHDTYSRLDYLMVDHGVLEYVNESSIVVISISDHAPVIRRIHFKEIEQIKGNWNLNEDLIEDIEVCDIVKKEIEQYFLTNNTPDVSLRDYMGSP